MGWARCPGLSVRPGAGDIPRVTTTLTFAAARSRAHGPTVALWHAVEVHRLPADLDGACELTVCGTLARVTTEQNWPAAAADACPVCAEQTR